MGVMHHNYISKILIAGAAMLTYIHKSKLFAGLPANLSSNTS